ncbi:MAG: glycosyltransferase family 4 protein [Gemmatimonadota bacterium]|nr:glycosyltransferase family 4 protein [Gemmatimonadota bacterium]
MRILYSYDTPMPNTGADTEQVVNTVAALARRGLDMGLLLPGPRSGPGDAAELRRYYAVTGEFTVDLLRWQGHGLRGVEKWSHALRAPYHPRAADADLVYTRNLPGAWRLLRAGRRVVYEHFRPWGDQIPPLQPFLRAVLLHPGLVGAVFHSEHTRRSYERIGIPVERMLVAHNGWDPARMEPRLERAEARSRLQLSANRFIVAYSGRMNLRKGLDVLLEVARRAPELDLLLIGSEGDGPVEAAARALPNVRVVPWQHASAIAPWLYAADVLVIPPSLAPLERHGNTVLPLKLFLYLAAGRALLAPRAPDTAELLTHDRNAVLVPAGDIDATVAALRALAADPARARVLGDAASATAGGLTWAARAGRIESFLRARLVSPTAALRKDAWTKRAWLRETGRWIIGQRPL